MLSVVRLMLQQIDQRRAASAALEAKIMAVAKADPAMRRLATIPGIGGLTAHAIVTAIGDGKQFASSRDVAAWCGLTPRGASSGLKRRHGGISRQGDIRLRKLLALGARTIIRSARSRAARATEWQRGILARRPVTVARGPAGTGRQDRPHCLGGAHRRHDLPAAGGRRPTPASLAPGSRRQARCAPSPRVTA